MEPASWQDRGGGPPVCAAVAALTQTDTHTRTSACTQACVHAPYTIISRGPPVCATAAALTQRDTHTHECTHAIIRRGPPQSSSRPPAAPRGLAPSRPPSPHPGMPPTQCLFGGSKVKGQGSVVRLKKAVGPLCATHAAAELLPHTACACTT